MRTWHKLKSCCYFFGVKPFFQDFWAKSGEITGPLECMPTNTDPRGDGRGLTGASVSSRPKYTLKLTSRFDSGPTTHLIDYLLSSDPKPKTVDSMF